jgi:hypothetical protein
MVFSRRVWQPNSDYARRSVTDDWIRALPREKTQIFETIVGRWESSFAMMSVALNDALSMRAGGELVCAQQHVSIAAALLKRLSGSLVGFCESLASRGRFIREVPLVEPLKIDFFRGSTAQSAATWNGILHHVIFGDRRRFVYKLRILSTTVEQLEQEFEKAAKSTAESKSAGNCWSSLDHLHYDFNTCLREAEVVFKSFLRALPTEQLAAFAGEMQNPPNRGRMRLRLRLSRASA